MYMTHTYPCTSIYLSIYIYISISLSLYIYIYIYVRPIHKVRIWSFGGFDLSSFLISRDGIPRSTGDFSEIETQRFLVCFS